MFIGIWCLVTTCLLGHHWFRTLRRYLLRLTFILALWATHLGVFFGPPRAVAEVELAPTYADGLYDIFAQFIPDTPVVGTRALRRRNLRVHLRDQRKLHSKSSRARSNSAILGWSTSILSQSTSHSTLWN